MPDHEIPPGGPLGTHPARPTKALGLLERGLDVGNAHVEQYAALLALATGDTSVDAGPVAGRASVHEPVVARGWETASPVANSHPNRSP